MPDSPTTTDLLALMQAGDLLALDRLVREYSDKLLAVARRRCRLASDAEDAVQQALVMASRAMTGIRGDGSPIAWLSTLVARTCSRLNAQAERTCEFTETPCTCDGPEQLAERRQLGKRLNDALMTLARTDRLLFLLAAEGFTGVELGERFGLSADAVRSRLKRAREHLRAALADTPEPARSTEGVEPNPRSTTHDDDPQPAGHR